MCGSQPKVKSASEIYNERKKNYGPLPSLSMTGSTAGSGDGSGPTYADKRTGTARRSLFEMIGGSSNA